MVLVVIVGAGLRKAVSLFSGAGGLDLGIVQAGFQVLADIEIDRHCCSTLRANAEIRHEQKLVFEEDIRVVQPHQILSSCQIDAGGLDLLCGGPPCQSFSLAGKQLGLSDARGPLLFEIVRFADVLKPKVVLVEQVKGLLSSTGPSARRGEVFESLLAALKDIGYVPKWRLVLAADYGIAQLRERLFIVATRDRNGFNFPERTHASLHECGGLFQYRPHVGVGNVLSGLDEPERKVKGKTTFERTDSHVDVTPERDRERIAQVPEGGHLAAQLHLGEELRRGLQKKDTTKYLRLHRDRPANTLRCGEIFYHPIENRYLTPREYMRIHGFPDDYILKGPIRSRTGTVRDLDQHRQVANSVPPPLARVIAEQIFRYLDEQNL